MRIINTIPLTKTVIPITLLAFALLGCGSGETKWGIDHTGGVEVTHGPLNTATGLYRCTLEDASLVKPGAQVKPLIEGTQLRVWHFQNSEEYVCTLKGQALIIAEEGASL